MQVRSPLPKKFVEKLAAKLGRAPTADEVAKAEAAGKQKQKFFKRLLGVLAAVSGVLLFK